MKINVTTFVYMTISNLLKTYKTFHTSTMTIIKKTKFIEKDNIETKK